MNVTIYLPADLARRAKAAGINLSRVAREAYSAALGEGPPVVQPGTSVCDICGQTVIATWRHLGVSDHTPKPKGLAP